MLFTIIRQATVVIVGVIGFTLDFVCEWSVRRVSRARE
jgi:hypothetical protein